MREPIDYLVEAIFLLLIFGIILLTYLIVTSEMTKDLRQEVDELRNTVEELRSGTGGAEVAPPEVIPNLGTVFPVHPDDFLFFTSAYGLRRSPFLGIEMQHNGVDIAAVWNAQVVAIRDGVVIEHWPAPGTPFHGGGTFRGHPIYGAMIRIDHGDMVSLYAHMSSTRVRQGQTVQAGEVIGRIGATGMARGKHLHLEIHVDGKPVNPLHYLPEVRND